MLWLELEHHNILQKKLEKMQKLKKASMEESMPKVFKQLDKILKIRKTLQRYARCRVYS